jgi:hypothetical protein
MRANHGSPGVVSDFEHPGEGRRLKAPPTRLELDRCFCHSADMLSSRIYTWLVISTLLLGSEVRASQCLSSGPPPGERVTKSTGNSVLDMQLNTEADKLALVFGVQPQLFILDDSAGANASAYCKSASHQASVSFGINLLVNELWSMQRGRVAVAGIMAHEWAHAYVCRQGGGLSGANAELIADYLAGYYLGLHQYLGPDGLRGFASSLFSKGDYDFHNPTHHGTPGQRVDAMVAGYATAKSGATNIHVAFSNGKSWLGIVPGGVAAEPARVCRNVAYQCRHAAHAYGDIAPCEHPAHPEGDLGPCAHQCGHPYTGIYPCHPMGDLWRCSHAMHPQGDNVRCIHPAHPEGDIQQICQ